MSLSTAFQLYRGGQFYFSGGNRSTRRKLPTCRKLLKQTLSHNVVLTLVVIGTDHTDSCKSNYNTIMTSTAIPAFLYNSVSSYLIHLLLFQAISGWMAQMKSMKVNGSGHPWQNHLNIPTGIPENQMIPDIMRTV